MSLSESTYWKEAFNSEIELILSDHTWELADLPGSQRVQTKGRSGLP